MLDARFVYENLSEVKAGLGTRGANVDWDRFEALYKERLAALREFESGRAEQRRMGEVFKDRSKSKEEMATVRAEMQVLSGRIDGLQKRADELAAELAELLAFVPNIPDASVPPGTSAEENREARTWGSPRTFPFTAQAHWDLGEKLDILDTEAGAKLSGARFVLYKGMGARLELALAQFMLDVAEERGYLPMLPPYLVSDTCMRGTGQLPKFAEEAYKVDDLYLIPTAEVPITNLHRGEILDEAVLPIKYVAYSSCFRREAGAAGRDTRGITRVHQFQKVELVCFCAEEASGAQLEALTSDAEEILRRLGLPYRVMELCSGDLGFSSAHTYDLEVWLPGQGQWREISSCSNFKDFQARRLETRYRPADQSKGKTKLVHTLNGSSLAIGRTIVALLENYQQADGTVLLPEVLAPYLGGRLHIKPR
jgi:seryl-tRNA synthetase